ncbi:MAG: HlyD family efflux transporter periplasmic adaptor subunit [Clostridia bacterium]|nr:HlyD family efflux transporter periplasmic adaptor subunit [Clostridia bacterium]
MTSDSPGTENSDGGKKHQPIVTSPARTSSSRTRRDMGMLIFVLAVLVGAAALAVRFLMPREKPYTLSNYTFAQVRSADFVDSVTAPGTVAPVNTVDVRAAVSGVVAQLNVAPGDEVNVGEPICVLQSPELVTRREEARRQVLAAEDALAKAKLDSVQLEERLRREVVIAKQAVSDAAARRGDMEKLFEAGAAPRSQVDEARSAESQARMSLEAKRSELDAAVKSNALSVETAARQVNVAKDALRAAEGAISQLVVRSPIRGKVLELSVVPGATASQGGNVAQVADTGNLVVKAKVPSTDVRLVTVGQLVSINLGGKRATGTVRNVAPKAETSGQGATVEVTIDFDSQPADVPPNSAAFVEIQVRKRTDVQSLPRGPYLGSSREMFVYIIEGTSAVQRDVRFGSAFGNLIEVVDGLSAGERVITSSYEEFKDRRKIKVVPEGGREAQ